MKEQPKISVVILAGGQGSRLNKRDKGLVDLDGKPLIQHCIDLIQGFGDQLVISCNRNQEQYAKFSPLTVSDERSNYEGPLSGLASAACVCDHEYVLTLPCDMPYLLPSSLRALSESLIGSEYDIAVADDGSRRQNLVMLSRKHCLDSIGEYLDAGKRRVDDWQNQWRVIEVDCSADHSSFRNLNTEADFAMHKKTPTSKG